MGILAFAFWSVLVAGHVADRVSHDAFEEVGRLKAQTAEMEARFAPRRVKSMEDYIRELSPFRGRKVDVVHITGDGETSNFFNEICLAVEESGWIIEKASYQSGQTWSGVIIEVNDMDNIPPAAQKLFDLLSQKKIVTLLMRRSDPPKTDKFTIRIGYKPSRIIK